MKKKGVELAINCGMPIVTGQHLHVCEVKTLTCHGALVVMLKFIPPHTLKMSNKTECSCNTLPSPPLLHSPTPACGDHPRVEKTSVQLTSS